MMDASLRRAALAFTALGAILLGPALHPLDTLGAKDWNEFLGQAQAELTTLRDYGQLPLWNPWRRGGQISLAQPGSMFFSPVTPIALLVGVVPAFKLVLLPLFVFGCLGMWVLAGHLGLGERARLIPPLVFFGSSLFPLYVCGGLPNWAFGMSLLPWLFLFQRRALVDSRFLPLAGATYAALLLAGDLYRFVFFPLLLGIDAAVLAVSRRSLAPLGAVGATLLIGICLAAVRLLPLVEVFEQFPRLMPGQTRFLTGALLVRALLGTELPDLVSLEGAFVRNPEWSDVYWINVGSYVGPAALLLALAGAVLRVRAAAPLLCVGAGFLWLTLGTGVRPSAWALLHQLPIYGSMQSPERLIVVVTFALALLAGYGFQAWDRALEARRLAPRLAGTLSVGVLLATALPLLVVNTPIAGTAFPVEPDPSLGAGGWFAPRRERPPFRQAWIAAHPAQFGGRLYEPVLRNVGNINGKSNVPVIGGVRPHRHPDYRGEVYLESGSPVASASITPNAIRVRADLERDDVLVVNQIFFPGWRAAGSFEGELIASQEHRSSPDIPPGLLSIALPAGPHELLLRYRPFGFAAGAAISALATAVALLYLGLARSAQPFGRREETLLLAYALLTAGAGLALRFGPTSLPW